MDNFKNIIDRADRYGFSQALKILSINFMFEKAIY